jgi:hypothetical protein
MKTGLCETRWTVPREAIEALFCRLFKIAARKWPCTFACTARWPDAASGLDHRRRHPDARQPTLLRLPRAYQAYYAVSGATRQSHLLRQAQLAQRENVMQVRSGASNKHEACERNGNRIVRKSGIMRASTGAGCPASLADWPPEKLKEAGESGSLLEASEVASVVTFMLTRLRGMTIRDVVMLPTNFYL